MKMMDTAEYQLLQDKLYEAGRSLTKAQIKAINYAAEGWDF